jgi:hypothetical protein
MKSNIFVIGLFLVSILILNGCAQQQTEYVCPDGNTVSGPSLCQQLASCGDSQCNGKETCESCPSDCGNCKVDCKVENVDNHGDNNLPDIKCTDETESRGYFGKTFAHCGTLDSTVPYQTHRSSKIVKDSIVCQNNRCIADSYVVKDCSQYDTVNEKALCGEGSSEPATCALYSKDGSYYKPIE